MNFKTECIIVLKLKQAGDLHVYHVAFTFSTHYIPPDAMLYMKNVFILEFNKLERQNIKNILIQHNNGLKR